ncbi:hypothetical protein [Burkholderia stagnalis]|uniref:hypothetical protein n=1 Tax=Burkholderia stagnalis TaxID=1503054 RepID=UPI000A90B404|nr:hypothetical protein [Burkholderia stagnalis]
MSDATGPRFRAWITRETFFPRCAAAAVARNEIPQLNHQVIAFGTLLAYLLEQVRTQVTPA